MNSSNEVTIITPVFNGLPHIKEAAGSVLNQSFKRYKWIISDDGSTDGSRDYLHSLQALGDERIEVFYQEKNLGIFGNLNFLCGRSLSDLIIILCQDDYFTKIDTVSLLLAKWENLDKSVGAARWNSADLPFYKHLKFVKPTESQLTFFLHGCIAGNLSNMSMRKSAWLATGPFDQRLPYAGDFDYWSRLCLRFSLALFPERAVYIRSHMMQASFQLNKSGELYNQLSDVTSRIYDRILPPSYWAKIILRLAGTYVYDTQYMRGLLLPALKGYSAKLFSLINSAKYKTYILNQFLRIIIFVASGGGQYGKNALISLAWKLNKGTSKNPKRT